MADTKEDLSKQDYSKSPVYKQGYKSFPNGKCPYDKGSGQMRTVWWTGFLDARFDERMKHANPTTGKPS